MLALQILIDGFAISALYGLGAVGFTLMFGVSGVLNLAHGATMVVAAVTAWVVAGQYAANSWVAGGAGTAAGPIQPPPAVPSAEREIFVLTGTLLWGIMIQEAVAYFYTDNPKTVRPLITGVTQIGGVRTPTNELLIAVICWTVIGLLWLLVNRTKAGKVLLAASINPRG